jgi:hypothetical protein
VASDCRTLCASHAVQSRAPLASVNGGVEGVSDRRDATWQRCLLGADGDPGPGSSALCQGGSRAVGKLSSTEDSGCPSSSICRQSTGNPRALRKKSWEETRFFIALNHPPYHARLGIDLVSVCCLPRGVKRFMPVMNTRYF